MPLHDYAALDEEDFYGQGFQTEGIVSVWVGLTGSSDDPDDLDVLQDLCGVGYYDLDDQEGNCNDFQLLPLRDLLSELSYASSFVEPALAAAQRIGLTSARWILVQFDFEYDPQRVKRRIENDPIFIGAFPYVDD